MRNALGRAVACAAILLVGASPCVAQESKAAPTGGPPVVIVDTQSVWRSFEAMDPPVIQFDDGPMPVASTHHWLDQETPAAPADWMAPEFADGTWRRGPARMIPRTPYLATVYQRARFEVTEASAVKDLKLSVTYYGGVIVYLNGQELARANLPKDAKGPESLAEGYPPAAFVTDKGEIIAGGRAAEQNKDVLAIRERKVTDLAIPAQALRKGVNVLAVEVIRAPYHKIVDEKKNTAKDTRELKERNCPYDLNWNTCEIRQVKLTASSPRRPGAQRLPAERTPGVDERPSDA